MQLKIKESKKISFFNQVIAIIKKRYVLVSYQEELALVSLKKGYDIIDRT
ncbi:hypothetical protein HIC20_00285 [Buchnera aphidicola (Hormaphis cornu)]|nr:hypothetical protein HIC20_00285 [Buchnera aphidicola (Hormaphis cornu)]